MGLVIDQVNLGSLKVLFSRHRVQTDNLVFRLHYTLSVFLVAFYSFFYSVVINTKTISCVGSKDANSANVISVVNDYCLVTGTYLINTGNPGN